MSKAADGPGRLLLVTGTGRSGTSTMSGTLAHLGMHVPGPYLGANESNPKGFYESRWAVRFHKDIVRAARIHEFDSRPDAFDRVQAVVTTQDRAKLVTYLSRQRDTSGPGSTVVVKDPRSVWVQGLWRDAAAEAGLGTCYVSMLRHPAEVVGSRSTYYANATDAEHRRRYETFNVARWLNSSLVSERETRGEPRALVRYVDLIEDWRSVVTRLAEHMDLVYPVPITSAPHPVDDFVEPGLRRHAPDWAGLDIPDELQDLAERVWLALCVVSDARSGVDPDAALELDASAEAYARLFRDAAHIAHDAIEEARDEARRVGAKEAAAEREAVAPAAASTVPSAVSRVRSALGVAGSRARRALRSRTRRGGA